MAEMQSIKRVIIGKTNTRIVAATGAAGFIVVFCLVASVTLFGQLRYQNRVIGAKKQALAQLKSDLSARDSLVNSYKAFVSTPSNLIGGSPTGVGAQDGDNAKIVLDALPSKYDFPALATSLEKMITSQNVKIQSITGTDDEVSQSSASSSNNPQPVAIPFQISVTGDYASIQNVIGVFEHSIRPIQVQTMEVTGNQGNLTLNVSAQTFYQPEKNLNITTKVIK